MTTAIFWRFLWKEYRAMRAFWIAMACLAVLGQLSLLAFPGLTHYAAAWTFSFALIFPALYAVACGATMFAAEKEEGTYEFLRGLPVTAWRILSGKLAFAIASTVLLIGVLLLTSDLLLNGRVVDAGTEIQLWGVLSFAVVEGLAWGILFSLVLRRPLQAAILAIAAASIGVHLIVRSIAPWSHWDNPIPYLSAIPYRVGVAMLVLFADLLLVPRWLETPRSPNRRLAQRMRAPRKALLLSVRGELLPATRGAVFGRLAWQSWRQSRGMMLILGLAGGLAAFASPLPGVVKGFLFMGGDGRIAVIVAAAALMGSCVFLPDQEGRRFHYFAEQAVPLRAVWLAKLLTWFAMLCAWAIVIHGVWFITQGGSEFLSAARETLHLNTWDDSANRKLVTWYSHLPPIRLSLYLTIAGFACGQLGSMFLRSGILAAFVGLVSTLILYGWAMLMQFLEISWLWSLAPIPLVLLFATWLRTSDWILERNTWRGWVRIAATLLCPLAALVFAMAFYRIYQIPDVSPGFSPVEYARSAKPSNASEETANMFVQAAYLLKDTRQEGDGEHRALSREAADLAYLRENDEALTIALRAAARPECSFDDVHDSKFQDNARELARLLAISARQLESEGKLGDAWDRWFVTLRFESQLQDRPWSYPSLPRWAAESGQTRERIASAIEQLERFDSTLRSPADRVKSWYLRARRAVIGGPDAIAASQIDISEASSVIPWSLLPWERSRALRLLNVCTASDLKLVESVRQAFRDGTPVTSILPFPAWNVGPERQEQQAWLQTTPLLYGFCTVGDEFWAWNWTSDETERRATRIVIAIEAWKVDHKGELPEHLSQLVGEYLDKLPLDPYSGKSFYFVRKGIAPPANLLTVMGQSPHWRTGPKKPFIWSPGDRVHVGIPPNSQIDARVADGEALPDNPDDITILEGLRRWRYPEDEYDVWLSGRSFEIP